MPLFNRSSFTEDTLCRDHYYIPTERERKRLSKLALAELLARPALAEPARILVEHELNIRLAQVQSRAAYWAAASTSAGIVLGWLLNQLTPPQALQIRCENNQATTEYESKASATKGSPPVPVITKEVQPGPQSGATQKKASDAKN